MKRIHVNLIISTITALLLSACSSKNEVQPALKKRYILSNEYNSTNNNASIKYFVNDVPATLGDASTSKIYGEDLEVVGTDVYVLASKQPISGGAYAAVIYKNGVELQTVPLASGIYYNCLAVSGNDIYMVGTDFPSGGVPKIIQWKNGTVTSITTNTGASATEARPYDLIIEGGNVYIAGFETATGSPYNRLPKYWKNGVAVTLSSGAGSYSAVHRILVSGNDIFCAGDSEGKPVYWKNGAINSLGTSNGWCYGIAVSGADVYTAGAVSTGSNIYNAVSWKNGIPTMLSNITAQGTVSVYGIGVDGNDVYVIGSVPDPANNGAKSVFWKNGILTELPTVTGNNGYAYRLVIK
ncbi:hypothetical protein [Sediminibacterium goheungense]|uniref:Beta-propeller repeat-containing protein n=1 Tax=Sediminibacterium goheungense TaxID=1086393 RepID=A0A4V3C4P8_9BACT|nr:hypothetical protein [Sediminibacterium goheungense]TDO26838.1 hypothetical protein BC659_2150 [Sediminibacterium goheungense]